MKEYFLSLPEKPFSVEMLSLDLGVGDQKRLLDLVTYNGEFDPRLITKAVGRNILFPLQEPIGSFDTVQVSGAGYFDIGVTNNEGDQAVFVTGRGGPIIPPQENAGRFTHTTTVVRGGEETSLVQLSPLGSYTQKAAKEKFANTILALQLINISDGPFIVPIPITRISYSNISDGQGGKQSALVWACPAKGVRAEDSIFMLLNQVTSKSGEKQPEELVITKFSTHFLPLLHAMGKSARFLHENGFCHYQMTYGNVSPLLIDQNGKPKICLYDWETLLPTDTTNPLLARAYDMSAVLSSNFAVIELMASQIDLSPETLATLGYNSFLYFLSGYTKLNPEGVHSGMKLTQEEIVSTFVSSREILTLMTNTVLPKIDNLSDT